MAKLIFIGNNTEESKEAERLLKQKTRDFVIVYLNDKNRPFLIDSVNGELFAGIGRIEWFLENKDFVVFNELVTDKNRMKKILMSL